ncbi:hypothetical protein R6Q57_010125 [Mikania cordata]
MPKQGDPKATERGHTKPQPAATMLELSCLHGKSQPCAWMCGLHGTVHDTLQCLQSNSYKPQQASPSGRSRAAPKTPQGNTRLQQATAEHQGPPQQQHSQQKDDNCRFPAGDDEDDSQNRQGRTAVDYETVRIRVLRAGDGRAYKLGI